MEKISHLWNVNQLIARLNAPQSANLQAFYMQSCKKLSHGTRLPRQNFSPATMCSHCGSLWNTVDRTVRVSRGRRMSRSIKKIVRSMNDSHKKLPRIRSSLGQKCVKNQMNRLVFKCSVCLRNTTIPFVKPKREKQINTVTKNIQSCNKRKKKKSKDKTAGLNISGIQVMDIGDDSKGPEEISTKKMGSTTNFITPTQKLKKLNIGKLKKIVKQGTTPTKGKSLHKFLKELS